MRKQMMMMVVALAGLAGMAAATPNWDARELHERCWKVLEDNTLGGDTPWAPYRGCRPSCIHFKGIWNWDSAFHALALVRRDAELARDQYRIMMKFQQPDGMLPDVIHQTPSAGVFLGCTKPPVWGWAVWTLDRVAPDAEFRRAAYDSLVRYERFWCEKRQTPEGFFHYDGNSTDPSDRKKFCGWESGWDDSPRWDGKPMEIAPIDLNCWMVLYYRSLRDLARQLGKGEEAERWQAKAERLTELVNARLWDARDQAYYDWDFVRGDFSRVLTPASFMPLYVGLASPERAAAMAVAARRLQPGWPTVAYDHPQYDPTGYWRGRTWLNVAYLALKGLKFYGYDEIADAGRATLLGWVAAAKESIYENYNSQTGAPFDRNSFGWSAVFTLKFLDDWQLKPADEVPAREAK